MKACILIPSFNTGPLLKTTVSEVLQKYDDVFVIVDGSTDGSGDTLEELLQSGNHEKLRVHTLNPNRGKGSAVLEGVTLALAEGYTHAMAMDADGQHSIEHIAEFLELSEKYPEALILGNPIYDESAPAVRVGGHKISNWWANLFTLWWGIDDSLFGMRLYPIKPLIKVFGKTGWARRFDFDPEVAVRLCWLGIPVLNLKSPVKYLSEDEGGVSQFRYLRDNILLIWMYFRLLLEFIPRFPFLLFRTLKGGNPLKNIGEK